MPKNNATSTRKRSPRKTKEATATTAPMVARAKKTVGVPAEPTHEQIAMRAYQLFEARGRAHGYDVEDWLRAEAELRSQPRA